MCAEGATAIVELLGDAETISSHGFDKLGGWVGQRSIRINCAVGAAVADGVNRDRCRGRGADATSAMRTTAMTVSTTTVSIKTDTNSMTSPFAQGRRLGRVASSGGRRPVRPPGRWRRTRRGADDPARSAGDHGGRRRAAGHAQPGLSARP